MATSVGVREDHPLARELTSLRRAVTIYQEEANASSVKLQRQSLEYSNALNQANILHSENERLRKEVQVLRTHPDTTPHGDALQVQELTLALRRLSEKLTLTENTLLQRTSELRHALREKRVAEHSEREAHHFASRLKENELEGRQRERELAQLLGDTEEAKKRADGVVKEYAELVKSMEGRQKRTISSSQPVEQLNEDVLLVSPRSVDTLPDDIIGRKKLIQEMNDHTNGLEAEILRLHGEIETRDSRIEALKKAGKEEAEKLVAAEMQVQKLLTDDKAAARMVSRYMKFSQSSTDLLHDAMTNMKLRHETTMANMEAQLRSLEECLANETHHSNTLRGALDELTGDISRELYGRRREISLRLSLISREENIAESFKRWYLKVRELSEKVTASHEATPSVVFHNVLNDLEHILESMDSLPSVASHSPGALARILVAEDAVSTLATELQNEKDKRLALIRQLVLFENHADSEHKSVTSSDRDAKVKLCDGPRATDSSTEVPRVRRGMAGPQKYESGDVNPVTSSGQETPATELIPLPETAPVQLHIVTGNSPASPPMRKEPSHSHSQPSMPRTYDTTASSPTLHTDNEAKVTFPMLEEKTETPVGDFVITLHHPDGSPPLSLQSDKHPFRVVSPAEPENAVSESNCAVGVAVSPCMQQELLARLAQVRHRYEKMQRGFSDCHTSLQVLRRSFSNPTLEGFPGILQRAVDRLDDFTDGVRVELEIRIADEERISKGYETLLSIPGAFQDEQAKIETLYDIEEFIDEVDPASRRTRTQFKTNLDDLMHDIAVIKSALHESETLDQSPSETTEPTSGWSGWAAGILPSPSRPSTPTPTFGNVITSPLLRHSSSFTTPRDGRSPVDRFAALGLRVPMPSSVSQPSRTRKPSLFNLGIGRSVVLNPMRSISGLSSSTNLSFNASNGVEIGGEYGSFNAHGDVE
ncbi:hypothetical protein BD410DRAFT_782408 [Rickenella mellea]|uniref:Uncharacterized protein n=1 Tax=Rickenella mellea TaxID=50990 RepID=A0A4Y7QKF6_9AGAM|nr:hypothetical protein BD410DRAFT_782408 [Rickenella mellea]